MIDNWSPITRQILALGLLGLILLLLINAVVAVARLTDTSLGQLADARHRVARLQSLQAHPPRPDTDEPVPANFYLRAASHQEAAVQLSATLSRIGSGAGIALDNMAIAPLDSANPALVQLSMRTTGKEEAIYGFVSQIESAQPLIRFRSWKIAPVSGSAGMLQLEAKAAVAWSSSR